MPRRLVVGLLLLFLAACTSAANGSADSKPTVLSTVTGANAHVAAANDVIIIIRDPAAAGSKSRAPKVAYSTPTGSGKPKELIVDSFDEIKRLEKRGKQHLQQPKEEQEYKQSASYQPNQEGDDGADSEQEEYPSKQKRSKGYHAEPDHDDEGSNEQEHDAPKSRHADEGRKADQAGDGGKYEPSEGREDSEYSRSKDSSKEHSYERSSKDDSSNERKQYKGDDTSSSYQQEEELTAEPDDSYRPDKYSRSAKEGRESDSSKAEEPESSEPPRRNTAGRYHKPSQDSASDSKHYKQQQDDDGYQPAPRKDAEHEDRHEKQQDTEEPHSDRRYRDDHSDKYSDRYTDQHGDTKQQDNTGSYRREENAPRHEEGADGGQKGSEEGSGAYPRLEEGGSYYTKPELHTTCLQVMRAAGDVSGLATYDLRCCTDSDNPKICDAQDKHDPDLEAGPYSIINRMPTAVPSPKGMMEVLKATSTLKVATCAFMPSDVPCPFYTAGACQVFNGTCMLSKAAADCGCPLNTGTGMLLEIAAYAEPVAGLSCNPVFTVARTGYGVVTNAVDDGAPYLGVANVMHGTGNALEDDDISARMTFLSGFGVPEQPVGRGVLTDGLPVMPLAKPAYNGRRTYGPRQLRMAFGPAPSSPMPHPDLPFFLGGRMLIEWSSSTGK